MSDENNASVASEENNAGLQVSPIEGQVAENGVVESSEATAPAPTPEEVAAAEDAKAKEAEAKAEADRIAAESATQGSSSEVGTANVAASVDEKPALAPNQKEFVEGGKRWRKTLKENGSTDIVVEIDENGNEVKK